MIHILKKDWSQRTLKSSVFIKLYSNVTVRGQAMATASLWVHKDDPMISFAKSEGGQPIFHKVHLCERDVLKYTPTSRGQSITIVEPCYLFSSRKVLPVCSLQFLHSGSLPFLLYAILTSSIAGSQEWLLAYQGL